MNIPNKDKSAFVVPSTTDKNGNTILRGSDGLTKQEYIATQVLAALYANPDRYSDGMKRLQYNFPEEFAKIAVTATDALLEWFD